MTPFCCSNCTLISLSVNELQYGSIDDQNLSVCSFLNCVTFGWSTIVCNFFGFVFNFDLFLRFADCFSLYDDCLLLYSLKSCLLLSAPSNILISFNKYLLRTTHVDNKRSKSTCNWSNISKPVTFLFKTGKIIFQFNNSVQIIPILFF